MKGNYICSHILWNEFLPLMTHLLKSHLKNKSTAAPTRNQKTANLILYEKPDGVIYHHTNSSILFIWMLSEPLKKGQIT